MKVVISLMLTALIGLACYYPGAGHMTGWDHMSWGYGGVFMWLIFLFLVFIGFIVYFVMRGEKWMKRGSDTTALDILKQRYAKGEITEQEFLKMKKDLES